MKQLKLPMINLKLVLFSDDETIIILYIIE